MLEFSKYHMDSKELINAEAHLWTHIFSFQNSMALKCAIELGIPDAIHNHGKPISIPELANAIAIHPSKAPSLYRLMRFLVHSNFFSRNTLKKGEFAFDLTINSRILVKDHPLNQAPFARCMLSHVLYDPASHLSSWFRNDASESPFHIAHGRSVWEYALDDDAKFSQQFNRAMASSTRLTCSLLMNVDELKGLFNGIESFVDVGGGDGTMAKALAEVYPQMKCVVLDLPHVVQGFKASSHHNLSYLGGDMFEAIPPSQVVLLKRVLHDWSDEHCIKILEGCKKAIPSKDEGGKVIVIDVVMIEDQNDETQYCNIQMLFDMVMMCNVAGKERTEEEWKNLFIDAGFSDYKICHVSASCSFIEVYP